VEVAELLMSRGALVITKYIFIVKLSVHIIFVHITSALCLRVSFGRSVPAAVLPVHSTLCWLFCYPCVVFDNIFTIATLPAVRIYDDHTMLILSLQGLDEKKCLIKTKTENPDHQFPGLGSFS
jgi:hypothetical protein